MNAVDHKHIDETLRFVRDHRIVVATVSKSEDGKKNGILLTSNDQGSAAVASPIWAACRHYISLGIDSEECTIFSLTDTGRARLANSLEDQ